MLNPPVFRLDGGGVTYAFGVNEEGLLQHIYFGPKLGESDVLEVHCPHELSSFDPGISLCPQEYPGWGGGLYSEPALKVAFAGGSRDLVLRYAGHEWRGDELVVELADTDQPIHIALHYSIDPITGVVARRARIVNGGLSAIMINQAFAAAWHLPAQQDYRLHYLTGHWASEWMVQERPVTQGRTVIESRRGSTGVQANPWFAVTRDGVTTEESGPAWFGALAWSGSWAISAEQGVLGDVRIIGGFNPFDFAYELNPGDALDTPIFYAGYSDRGLGEASRLLHRFTRDEILPRGAASPLRKVLYNSWEATHFEVEEAGQMALAERAAAIGCERFVIDDGWFGARGSDRAGLGDWTVNAQKFPRGLKPLIDRVQTLGMDFGLWVEPEMVNPDSDLYRAHSDWVIHMKGRPRTEARNQLVLNLARRDVRKFVFDMLDRLVSENDIAFLKWDHNRNWSEPGWPSVAAERQQRLYVDYVEGLYAVITKLRAKHPYLEIESCAGGGGRVDLGIMKLADQVWPSDNSDPFDRLSIQHGFSLAYPASTMVAWVTASPHWVNRRSTSLNYRFLSAMQGALGIGDNLNAWDQRHMEVGAQMIAAYKDVRELVQCGDLYRLISPLNGSDRSATLYVAPDKGRAVLFAFLHSSTRLHSQPRIRLAGLDPETRYRIRSIDTGASESDVIQSGAYWMGQGVDMTMRGDFQAAGRVFEVV